MKGTTTIKKNNAIDHIKNLLVHQIAVLCVTEKKTMWKVKYSCLFYQTAVLTSVYPTFESS